MKAPVEMRYWAIVACLLSVACTSLVSAQVMLLPAELLPWLGVKEGAGGGYTAQTSVTLPPDLLRLGRPPLFGPPPPLLCNLTLQGQLPSSELDTSTAQTKTGMVAFRVGKGAQRMMGVVFIQSWQEFVARAIKTLVNAPSLYSSRYDVLWLQGVSRSCAIWACASAA